MKRGRKKRKGPAKKNVPGNGIRNEEWKSVGEYAADHEITRQRANVLAQEGRIDVRRDGSKWTKVRDFPAKTKKKGK